MGIFDRIVEEKIQAAIEAGEFDNLPGKGKPLHLEDNPFESEEWRMAFAMLRNNGYTLEWIELRKEIEAERGKARKRLLSAWESAGDKREQDAAKAAFSAAIAALNRKIFEYNVRVPSPVFEYRTIDIQAEFQSVVS